jgi:hypothetical protein
LPAQPVADAEISAAQAPVVQERDAVAHLPKRVVELGVPVLCRPDAARFEERSCAAVAQSAEALMKAESGLASLAPKKVRAKPALAAAEPERPGAAILA